MEINLHRLAFIIRQVCLHSSPFGFECQLGRGNQDSPCGVAHLGNQHLCITTCRILPIELQFCRIRQQNRRGNKYVGIAIGIVV